MPFANNEGVKIYYEVEGQGPPLVLLHGWTGSLEILRQSDSCLEALKRDYTLVLVDARGHGKSDKPHEAEAYGLESMAGDIVAVLDGLKIRKAHFWGYSMGGWIGMGLAKYTPERFYSLVIGGYGPQIKWDPQERGYFLDIFNQGLGPVGEAFRGMFGQDWTPEIQAIILANDLDAQAALLSREDFMGLPGFEEWLPEVTIPCLFYAGENTWEYASAQAYVKKMPKATLVSFPGLTHVEAGMRADLLLPHLTRFLGELGQA